MSPALLSFFLFISVSQGNLLRRSIFDDGNGFFSYPLSIISDQDSASRDKALGIWFSTMISANLHISQDENSANIEFLSRKNFTSKFNYNGRGMELSDLKMYNGKLLSVDDKTGIIYRLLGKEVIPWVIFAEADGNSEKPFKGEWLAVKNNILYCGGYGKEMTTTNGTYVDDSPFWIKEIRADGGYDNVNWRNNFLKLREHLNIHFPGYMIHESAQWSNIHKRWFFLPRHLSKLQYTSALVHTTGANVLLSASADFSNITHVYIGTANTTRGFSAFQFVPGTGDRIIVALKSVEEPDQPLDSYIMVFDVNGNILLNETQIEGNLKCEGVEFFDSQLGIYPFAEYSADTSSSSNWSTFLSLLGVLLSVNL